VAKVFVWAVGEGTTTSTPNGRRGHTGTGAAGAFLTKRFGRGVADRGAGFLRTGTLARIGLISHHNLVHQGFVVFTPEYGVGDLNL
jgi:hypothetical protein